MTPGPGNTHCSAMTTLDGDFLTFHLIGQHQKFVAELPIDAATSLLDIREPLVICLASPAQ